MSVIGELIMSVVEATVPPDGADPKLIRMHRWRLTLVSCGAFCGLVVLYLLSFGKIPSVFPGFATHDDVAKISDSISVLADTLKEERASTLDQQLFSLRVLDCQATLSSDKILYTGRIRDLERRYLDLVGRPYDLPSCSEL